MYQEVKRQRWRARTFSFCIFKLVMAKRHWELRHAESLLAQHHDDVIKWKHFPRYWPYVRGIHRSPVNSPHKGQWRGALMFSFICVWINGWVNNGEAGDLRRYRAHHDVIVLWSLWWGCHDVLLRCSILMMVVQHWCRLTKMAAIFQKTFSNGFSLMKMYEFRLTSH